MGTYHTSRIRTASKDYICGGGLPHKGCGIKIERGEQYLSFAPGQRGRIAICMKDKKKGEPGCAYFKGSFGLKYNCADMVIHIANRARGVRSG